MITGDGPLVNQNRLIEVMKEKLADDVCQSIIDEAERRSLVDINGDGNSTVYHYPINNPFRDISTPSTWGRSRT